MEYVCLVEVNAFMKVRDVSGARYANLCLGFGQPIASQLHLLTRANLNALPPRLPHDRLLPLMLDSPAPRALCSSRLL